MLPADSVGIFEAAHTPDPSLDPTVILLKSKIDVCAVADDVPQPNCARVGVMSAAVTRSGAKPAIDRAERKNLREALTWRASALTPLAQRHSLTR